MSYTVLARRYRSRSFDELIGQEPIARTLRNAIEEDRTAHAYLFTGTRGVGKTSMARIFAAALNVTDDLEQKDQIREAIFRGEDLDVIEIDGASNRGINEARDLIAGAGLSPARSPYKIYIIDEVHMLTREAFNALLKTMEEPPAHVKFILCTTEAHKVPATIQSRCQRFDFRPLPTARIAEQLKKILAEENIKAGEDAIMHLARLGNGSMRDALSLLDRLLATGEAEITEDLLMDMLGLPDQARVLAILDAIIAADAGEALDRAAELLAAGTSIEQALETFVQHLRHLMLISACGSDSPLIELTGDARDAAARQAEHFDTEALVYMIALCDAVARNVRSSAVSRALFEALIVRLCHAEHLASIPQLLAGGAPNATTTTSKKKALNQPPAPAPPDKQPATRAPEQPIIEPKLAPPEKAAPKKAAPETAAPETTAQETPAHETPASTTTPAPTTKHADFTSPTDLWQHLIDAAHDRPTLRAAMQEFQPLQLDDDQLTIRLRPRAIDRAKMLLSQKSAIETFAGAHLNQRIRLNIEQPKQTTTTTSPRTKEKIMHDAAELPLVKKTVSLFDAAVIHAEEIDNA